MAGAAVSGELATREVHLRQRRDDLTRELTAFPVIADRGDIRLEVVTNIAEQSLLLIR